MCVPSQGHDVTNALTEKLGLDVFVAARTLSFADLYAGKFAAALDRQHPREIFDVKVLLDDIPSRNMPGH
ncbi:MAG: hypothetical protein GF410_02625 [Chitinivibrionales bacterium]|nr:hypothetical protein [Chitinivibrionales bacterium]